MIHFRVRDLVSVWLYRLCAFAFGEFGRRVRIVWPLRIVGARHLRLEDDVTLQYGAYVAVIPPSGSASLRIRRGAQVGNFSHLICTRSIEIGEKVLIADRVYISDNQHGYRDVGTPVMDQPLRQTADVVIGEGTWIGENACIVGCRIGRHAVIGANSVVTRDIPDFCVAAGVPAVLIRRWCPQRRDWFRTAPDGEFAE